MTKIKRLVAVAMAFLMIFGSMSVLGFAWDADVDDGFTLGITTEILRNTGTDAEPNWVPTDKVNRGEEVIARVYLNTDYFTSSGSLLFFYNNDFFTSDYDSSKHSLTVNDFYANAPYSITGSFYTENSGSYIEEDMLDEGAIDDTFAAENDYINVYYSFGAGTYNQYFDGSKWFCQFNLKVKDDAVGTGRLLAVEETTKSYDFVLGGIDVPKGPSTGRKNSVVTMDNWDATLNYVNHPVSLYNAFVTASFDANGGAFEDGSNEVSLSGEVGDPVDLEEPTRNNYKFLGWAVKGDEENYSKNISFPANDAEYVAVWESIFGDSNTLKFKTEFYRLDAETGEWIYTEKVKRGEDVVARFFIDASYFTNAGDLIAFYDKDFFTDQYELNKNTAVAQAPNADHSIAAFNNSPTSSAALVGAFGSLAKQINTRRIVSELIEYGHITQEFADSHVAFTFNYKFTESSAKKITGEEWFVEIPLHVSETASGRGYFMIVDDTICDTTDEGLYGYINIPVNVEGAAVGTQTDLWNIDVDHEVENHYVEICSSITFNANGGEFDAADTEQFVIEGAIGDTVDASAIPAISKDGSTFKGWVDATIEEPTIDDIIDVPAELPYDDLVLDAFWVSQFDYTFVPNNGDPDEVLTATSGDPFEPVEDPELEGNYFIGWTTDPTMATVTGLPDVYPAEDTTYYAVFSTADYITAYYVQVPGESGFKFVGNVSTPYGDPIIAVPPAYVVPDGYTLSPAYTDVSLAQPLEDGATMPANKVVLYYELLSNTYEAEFYLEPEDVGTEDPYAAVETKFNEKIVAPAAPTKEGYVFVGWDPEVGYMDEEGKVFVATWEVAEFKATYIVDGETYEEYTLAYGDAMETPADPYKEGYEFTGWTPAVADTMPAEDVEYVATFEAQPYTATFDAGEGAFADEDKVKEVETIFGEAIEVPDDPEREGYTFAGWDPIVPDTMPAEELEFEAVWTPNTDTPYKITVYTMDTEGEYDDGVSYNMTGVTDTTAIYNPIVPEGFYLDDSDETKTVLSANIEPDGSTELVVYLARDEFEIDFIAAGGKFNDGSTIIEGDYFYGADVVAPEDPVREGYTFKGWEPSVKTTAKADATYTAQWEINTYTLTYTADGEVFAEVEYDYNEEIIPLADEGEVPTKFGYTFDSWTPDVPETMPAEDVTVDAVFTPNTYDAKFYVEPEDKDADDPYEVVPTVFDTPIEVPDDPEKEGYEFGGWSEDGETPVIPGDMDDEGKEYIAIWVPAEVGYTVEYYYMDVEGNYSDTPDRVEKVEDAVTGSIAEIVPADEEKFTLNTTDSILSAEVLPDGSTTLKVYYDRNKSTLTIDKNDGSAPETFEYYVDAPVDPVDDPEKEGYEFDGWVDEVPETMPNEDVNAVAQWVAKEYKVTYIVDGEEYYGPEDVTFGDVIPEPSVPTKVGYVFSKWVEETDGKKPSEYGTMPAKDLVFDVDWIANASVGYKLEVYEMGTDGEYPVTPTTTYTFSNGVVNEEASASVEVPTGFTLDTTNSVLTGTIPADPDETLVLKEYLVRNAWNLNITVDEDTTETEYFYQEVVDPVADPEKTGYVFTGWIDENDEPADIPVTMPNEDVYRFATFEIQDYPATFNAGEGKFGDGTDTKSKDVTYGDPIVFSAEPELEGYEFTGWTKDSTGEFIPKGGNLGRMDADGESFTAVYEVSGYTVKFYDYIVPEHKDIDEGTAYVYDEQVFDFGEVVEFPEEPSIKFFEFTGWVDKNGDPVTEGELTMPASNLEIYATYKRVKVALIPKNDTCTTQIERDDSINEWPRVDDYTAESEWFVYGLKEKLTKEVLLDQYIDVMGDGYIKLKLSSDRFVGTGTVIEVYDYVTGELVESFWAVIFGDIDGNGVVRATDVSMCRDESIGKTGWSDRFDPEYRCYRMKAADVDGNGVIRSVDEGIIDDHSVGTRDIDQVTGKQAIY